MNSKFKHQSAKNIFNPFEGRIASEVWNELKTNSTPVDKDKILAELSKYKKLDI